ncbi:MULTISPECIES: prepilin peptidase [Dorea]|uniref:prepilin peptidase n=1 Tax=Dorea TaxID=189330 RepID=UPI0022E88E2E|nr:MULTISPECIES: prepilin peptidase [Dorea]
MLLFLILVIAAIWDYFYRKIPNWLICLGLIIGWLFSTCSIPERILSLLALFIIGMFGLMGMGDIKLWIVIALFLGFIDSCYLMGLAALLLILHQFIKNWKNTMNILTISLKDFWLTKKIRIFDQISYAFSPYILISFVILQVINRAC